MDAVLEAHALECLFALQVVFLVDLVQILHFLSPLVLFFKVAQVAVHLLLTLLDSVANLSRLLLLLVLLHLLDFIETFVSRDFVRVKTLCLEVLLYLSASLLHLVDFFNVLAHTLELLLRLFFLEATGLLQPALSTLSGFGLDLAKLSLFPLLLF